MRCLLLAPLQYPFLQSVIAGLQANNLELKAVDYQSFFSARVNARYNDYTTLPMRLRRLWEEPYVRKTNAEYRRIFKEFQPHLVFIYNNQLARPELLEEFKRSAKIAFFLGDNPLYTPSNIYNLHLLFYADYLICPDSLWCEQLTQMGVPNAVFDCFGFNSRIYHPMEVSQEEYQRYRSDFIYVGSASKTNWGYKRMLFLDLFKNLDFKAYISGSMERWYGLFPGAASKIVVHDRFDAAFNNLVYNCSKIAPVELVPSLFRGIHVRVFDILGSGILPLCEYSADLERVFEGIELPLIRNYREAEEVARFWLADEPRRKACISAMRARVLERYTPQMVIRRMLDALSV